MLKFFQKLKPKTLKLITLAFLCLAFLIYLIFSQTNTNEVKPIATDGFLPTEKTQEFTLKEQSQKNDFTTAEQPEFSFELQKKRNPVFKLGALVKSFFSDEYKNIKIKPVLVNTSGHEVKDVEFKTTYDKNGKFSVRVIKPTREFANGKFYLRLKIDGQSTVSGTALGFEQSFTWGVLAFNSNKSTFLPNEEAYLQLAVLDDEGKTLCDADLTVEIDAPWIGGNISLSTEKGTIIRNKECGPENVISLPDYYAYQKLSRVGTYAVKIRATTKNGVREINDSLVVANSIPFEVERVGPTRIFPKANYTMKIKIKANEDYAGTIKEIVPKGFVIVKSKFKTANVVDGKEVLVPVSLKAGQVFEFSYVFDAPDVSPEFYLLGPLKLGSDNRVIENRQWQIASDALTKLRAKTVQFLAGNYVGNGTTGQNSNTNQVFSAFDLSLAERNVTIENAYVIFEAQYEAYISAALIASSTLVFDSCQGSCNPLAFTGTSTVDLGDSTILSYDETNSANQARLIFDVTNEGDLSAYKGNGVELNAQIGYRINMATTQNSIASARSILVLTYTYDRESPNLTNTVFYPLDSFESLSGTKSTSTLNNCAFNVACPRFNYNMDLPEYVTATGSVRLSQWFQMQNQNDLNVANDVGVNLRIGTNATSSTYLLEASRSDQGNLPTHYFSNVAGYAENTAQTIQYRASSSVGTYYLLGGEVAETYTASSSALTKTRTVSFPVGVITNISVASSSNFVDVYFPENGMTATGTVKIKKAWLRIIGNNYNSAVNTLSVDTKVASRATTSAKQYSYNPGAAVAKPSFNIIHTIPTTDYVELESANGTTSKRVTLEVRNTLAGQGGVSAELMITYTYTDESLGYLTSLNLNAGQTMMNPLYANRTLTVPVANSVLPETAGVKTMLAGALLASYLNSDNDGGVGSTNNVDANISTGAPTCPLLYFANTDSINSFNEFYKNITSALNTTNNQSYTACYANTGGGDVNTGSAKMNGQLIYTYKLDNNLPTSTISSLAQGLGANGQIDLSVKFYDMDNDQLVARMYAATGTACNFTSPAPMVSTINTSGVTASSGVVVIDNAQYYRIGSSSGTILTASENQVNFDWDYRADIGAQAVATYCVGIMAFDGLGNQSPLATKTILIDTQPPTISGITIPDQAFVIGDTIRATITVASDVSTFFLASSSKINVATTTNLQKVDNTTYTFDYLVLDGDFDRASNTIPYDIVLIDQYGNRSASSTGNFVNGYIDANSPKISSIVIRDLMFKVGDVMRATITVATDLSVFSLRPSLINNRTVTNLQKINNTTYTVDYVIANGDGVLATGSIPYDISLVDSYGNKSASSSGNFLDGSLDAQNPVIQNVYITNGIYKISDSIKVIIQADQTAYTESVITVNGKNVTGFFDKGDTNYEVYYNVTEGDVDRLSGLIPVSIVLADNYGNINSVYTTTVSNTASVDANKPKILKIYLPNRSFLVGDTITATATVLADDDPGYTMGTTTMNGVDATNFVRISSTTYTFDYTVVNGNTDRSAGTVPVSLMINDGLGQYNDPASTTVETNTASIDANIPVINSVSFLPTSGVLKIGDTATITIAMANGETGVVPGSIMKVNGQDVFSSFTSLGGGSYRVLYTVSENDTDKLDSEDLPVNFIVKDAAGNPSAVYFTADTTNRPGVDAHRPTISSASFNITSGLLKIGDIATITISASEAGLASGTMMVNGVDVAPTLKSAGGNDYIVTYTVAEGQADVADTADLPVSFTLLDPAGNPTLVYNTADINNRPGVDGHKPVISNVTFNITSGVLKVGDIATATIFADGTAYASGTMTINGVNVASTLQSAGGNNYTVTYLVIEGQTDVLDNDDLPISFTLVDAASNVSAVYNTANIAGRPGVDAHKPVIATVVFLPDSGVMRIGSSATATISVSPAEAGLSIVSATINSINVAGTFTDLGAGNYRVVYTVVEGHNDINDISDLPVSFRLVDAAGNQSDFYAAADAANRPGVDGHKPIITSVTSNTLSGVLRIGEGLIITIVSDGSGYVSGTMTINGVNVANTLASAGGNSYTVSYTVTEGDNDVLDSADLPVSFVLIDAAGNSSAVFNTPDITNRPGIDAHRPVISNVTFNITSGVLKIGQIATATLVSDGTGYSAGVMTINGVNVDSTLKSAGGSNYTVTYTVQQGQTDIADSADLPVSFVLYDAASNNSLTYNSVDIANRPGVDAHAPTTPGNLTFNRHTNNTIVLNFGATTTEANFAEYKIFYKVGSTGVTEADSLFSSSTDANLGNILFNNKATTTLLNLATNTQYAINIWAYDRAGNKTSATEMTNYTNRWPVLPSSMFQKRYTGTTVINGSWLNEPTLSLEATSSDPDGDAYSYYFQFVTDATGFATATSVPAASCNSGIQYGSCASKIWKAGTRSDWYSPNWPYRKQIIIDGGQITSSEARFPFLASTSHADLKYLSFGGHVASSTGGEMVMTDSDGITLIPYEREYYSSSTGQFIAWVSTSSTAWTHKILYLYYGNSVITTSQASTTGPWDNVTKLALHLDNFIDSSPSRNNSTNNATTNVIGQIYNAKSFSGAAQWLSTTVIGYPAANAAQTISVWAKYAVVPAAAQNLVVLNNGVNSAVRLGFRNGRPTVSNWAGGNLVSTTTLPAVNVWHNYVYVYAGGNVHRLYIDGQLASSSVIAPNAGAGSACNIGRWTTGTEYWNGQIDEVRISTGVRSAGWIMTSYLNQKDMFNFTSYSTEQASSASAYMVLLPSITDAATGYKWQTQACDSLGACSDWSGFNGTTPNVKIDTVAPTMPGNLTLNTRNTTDIVLRYGATTTETNFSEYKIFYKMSGTDVTEADLLFGSSSDANLGNILYSSKATTTIINLTSNRLYTFNIWAFDQAGNKSRAFEYGTTTIPNPLAPTGLFNSIAQKTDGFGSVDISITVDDANNDDLHARIDYVAGTSCNFAVPLDPTLDTNAANISASAGTVLIDNASVYQVGTSTNWINTNSGPNTVNFDWLSKANIPGANGVYCLRLTANDSALNQATSATSTVLIDNVNPTTPGNLTLNRKSTYNLVLNYGATSTETNIANPAYRLYYRQGTSGVVEGDTLQSDSNLSNILFNASTTTTITGLSAGTAYVFNIWAYDIFGNKASATQISFTTNYIPSTPNSLGQWRNDGTTAIINQSWTNENNFKLRASVLDSDTTETLTLYFEVASTSDAFTDNVSNACASTTSWSLCPGRVWKATSTSGNYSVTPFTGTVNPTNVPDSATGIKWQVQACDLDGVCSAWMAFNGTTPNIKINATPPTIPGALTISSVKSSSTVIFFGAPTNSLTFYEYKIFYKVGASGVRESDSLLGSTTDMALGYVNYFGQATTTVMNLLDGTNYVFNIWAYDIFGRKASATVEVSTTTNYAPTAIFTKAQNRKDATGIVDISFTANDLNQANLKAKLEYATGTACDFTVVSRPTLDEADANATSTFGDAKISNANEYQVGDSSGWILTTSGANTVNFSWLSMIDLPQGDTTYCLRLTANDGIDNQRVLATTTVVIDNVVPTEPGNLLLDSRTSTSLVLRYGATTTETNFLAYKIFYRSGAVNISENDPEHSDANLFNILFNGKTTTTRDILLANQQYSFRIYAYDSFGHVSSSSVVTYTTNAPPTAVFNSAAEKTDASGVVDISIEVYDINGDGVKAQIEYATGTTCNFSNPGKPTLDTNPANISADFDLPDINNANNFQIGSSVNIKTASGSNTVNFDWNTPVDLPNATSSYCLRLTTNDGKDNQEVLATTTLIVDNVTPVAPGNLAVYRTYANRVILTYGTAGSDTNFKEYKIFYKKGSSGVSESDSVWNKYNSNSLGYVNYSTATSTLLTGLDQLSLYYFNIWIYDNYGHKAQASGEVSTTTVFMPSATWREDEDISDPTTSSYLGKAENFRLRIAVANLGDASVTGNYDLEYAPKGSGCASAVSWTAVPASATSQHFSMADSVYFAPGASTTKKFANSESYFYVPGYVVKAPLTQASGQKVDVGEYTELEYAIKATTQSLRGGTYCFRITDNGQMIENYGLYPELTLAPAPLSRFASAQEKGDASGRVDISIEVGNPHRDFTRAKIEYATGTTCNFSVSAKPLLDQTPANINATYGTVSIDNAYPYQIGTSTEMIDTRYGTNTIDFDWDAKTQLGLVDNTYCLRLTANDLFDDQLLAATRTVIVDQISPTVPGNLTQFSLTSNSATLGISATSTDSHFREYRIYYKEGQSGVTESDMLWASTSDANLGKADLNGATTTAITGLSTNKYYVFKLFAYDDYGNKSQSVGELVVIIRFRAKSENWRFYYDAFNETPTSTMAVENAAPSNVSDGSTIKLRLGLREVENVTGLNIKTRLQYSTYADFSADVHFVGELGSSTLWTYGNGIDADGSNLSKTLLTGISASAIHNESGTSASTYTHPAGTLTEWEYTIRNNTAIVGTTYYFRAFDNQSGDAVTLSVGYFYPSIVTGAQMFSSTLSGLAIGSSTEGVTANISSAPTSMNFGTLSSGAEKIGIQRFIVNTNAGAGYQLYMYQRKNLISNNGAVISPVSGTNDNPQAWPVSYTPSAFGYHSGDDTLSGGLPSRFASNNTYAQAETGMKEIGYSPIPVTDDVIDLVFRIGSTNMQGAGDFETEIVYILVPTFY